MTQSDHSYMPVARICAGCGKKEAGFFPAGWRITPLYGPSGGSMIAVVVGERPLCPDCQGDEQR